MNPLSDLGGFDMKGFDFGSLEIPNMLGGTQQPKKKEKKNPLGELFGSIGGLGNANNSFGADSSFGSMLSSLSRIPVGDNLNLGQYIVGQFLPTPSKGG